MTPLTEQQPTRQLKTSLPSALLRDVKILAAERSTTIKSVVAQALEAELLRRKPEEGR